MHVLLPRQAPAGTVKATAQESEEGNTARPPGCLGMKNMCSLSAGLPVTLKTEDKLNAPSL